MTALLLALAAAYGTHLVFTAIAFGWRGLSPGPPAASASPHDLRTTVVGLLEIDDVRVAELLGAVLALAAAAGVAGWALFGGVLPPTAFAAAGAAVPIAAARSRRERRQDVARESWPRLIEEIRIKATTLGRSIPQALFEVGRSAPQALRPAFDEARREWLLSTDFERTLSLLRARLADPTADSVCETLLIAHHVGGNDVDRTLAALRDDRVMDLEGRKDAAARQAGARFARSFTLAVPLGMAFVGLSIGNGRSAYGTPTGQLLVVVGLVVMAACWLWAGRIMRLPSDRRVLVGVAR